MSNSAQLLACQAHIFHLGDLITRLLPMASFFAIWYILYHTTVDRKAISVDVMLSAAHALIKILCAKV